MSVGQVISRNLSCGDELMETSFQPLPPQY